MNYYITMGKRHYTKKPNLPKKAKKLMKKPNLIQKIIQKSKALKEERSKFSKIRKWDRDELINLKVCDVVATEFGIVWPFLSKWFLKTRRLTQTQLKRRSLKKRFEETRNQFWESQTIDFRTNLNYLVIRAQSQLEGKSKKKIFTEDLFQDLRKKFVEFYEEKIFENDVISESEQTYSKFNDYLFTINEKDLNLINNHCNPNKVSPDIGSDSTQYSDEYSSHAHSLNEVKSTENIFSDYVKKIQIEISEEIITKLLKCQNSYNNNKSNSNINIKNNNFINNNFPDKFDNNVIVLTPEILQDFWINSNSIQDNDI